MQIRVILFLYYPNVAVLGMLDPTQSTAFDNARKTSGELAANKEGEVISHDSTLLHNDKLFIPILILFYVV